MQREFLIKNNYLSKGEYRQFTKYEVIFKGV